MACTEPLQRLLENGRGNADPASPYRGVSAPHLEHEANRVAGEVWTRPAFRGAFGIGRQRTGRGPALPPPVRRVVAERGRPLEPSVRRDVMAVVALAGVRARIRGGIIPPGAAAAEGAGSAGRGAGAAEEGALASRPAAPVPGAGGPAGSSGGARAGSVTPLSSHRAYRPRFPSRSAPPAASARSARPPAYGPGGTARQLLPAEQPVPEPIAPVPAPASAVGSQALEGPGVQPVLAGATGLGSGVKAVRDEEEKEKRSLFVLRLPQEKAPRFRRFRNWIAPDIASNLRSDPDDERGAPAQLGRWHREHRVGGAHGIPAGVYERGHRLGMTGATGEERIRVPDWSPTGRRVLMQVDHVVELQLTPSAFRADYFDTMDDDELLDQGANASAGPTSRANVAAERKKQEAFDSSLKGQILRFDAVQMDGGSPGERWSSDDVRTGRLLDACPG